MKQNTRLPLALILPAGFTLVLLLGLPSLIVITRAFQPSFLPSLFSPVVTEALRLSLMTTAISLVITIVLGTPLAYLLARFEFRGKRLLDTMVDLPLVLPPTVAGMALLLTFGRRGLIGSALSEAGITIAFTSTAVILAQVFVASPLYIRAMKTGFSNLDPQYEAASLSLGLNRLSTFWRVSLPLCLPSFVEGVVLSWARALGEFGATIVFAGSLQGRTQTMPLAIYAALEQDLDAALALSALLSLVAFALLFIFKLFTTRST